MTLKQLYLSAYIFYQKIPFYQNVHVRITTLTEEWNRNLVYLVICVPAPLPVVVHAVRSALLGPVSAISARAVPAQAARAAAAAGQVVVIHGGRVGDDLACEMM